jgi:hypothetical protein
MILSPTTLFFVIADEKKSNVAIRVPAGAA